MISELGRAQVSRYTDVTIESEEEALELLGFSAMANELGRAQFLRHPGVINEPAKEGLKVLGFSGMTNELGRAQVSRHTSVTTERRTRRSGSAALFWHEQCTGG